MCASKIVLSNPICTKHIKNSIYILIYSDDFCTISKIYSKLGQHNYRTKDPDNIKEYIHTYSTGIKSIYVGQLKAGTNEAEGVGIKVWDSGFIYEGEWKNDKLDGYGRSIWGDGAYYIGEWKDSKKHGYGEFYYSYGDVYKGNWVENSKEGQGTMTYKSGTVKSGLWKKGDFQG